MVGSIASIEWGVADFSPRVAMILFGLICMGLVVMIERSKGPRNPKARSRANQQQGVNL